MDREIKFRAWVDSRHGFGKMINWEGLQEPFDPWESEQSYLDFLLKYKNVKDGDILMQYTGLKDKNGKEIYEGDVVKTDNITASGEIVWDRFAWFIKLPREKDFYHQFIDATGQSHEVIGNIYENPELCR